MGIVLECVLLNVPTLAYPQHTHYPPIWIVCLYPLFALTLNHSLNFLDCRWLLGASFGAVGGPLSYFAGSRLGAVTVFQYFPIALFWALFMGLNLLSLK